MRDDKGGGLSAGAIAGIAVGCAAGAAVLGAAAVLLLARRRRRQRLGAPAACGKAIEGSDSTAFGDPEIAGEHSGPAYPPPQPLAAQPAGQQGGALSQPPGMMQQGQQGQCALELSRAPSTGLISPFTASAVAATIFDGPSRRGSGELALLWAASAAAPGPAGAAHTAARATAAAASRAESGAALQLGPRLGEQVGRRPPRPPGSQRISFDEPCCTPPNGLAGATAGAAASRQSSLHSPATPFALVSRNGGAASSLAPGQHRGSSSTRPSLDALEGIGEGALDRDPSGLLLSASASMLPSAVPLPE